MKTYKLIFNKQIKKCPNCNSIWDGIECNNCSFDIGFNPNWD